MFCNKGETLVKTTRKEFIGGTAAFAAASHFFPALAMSGKKETIKIRQIRNATLRVRFGGVEFLIDPWLASKSEGMTFRKGPFASEVVDPAQLDIVMPMCELPMPLADVLSGVDTYVLTHLHRDHFDMAADGTAGAKLDKAVPLFVQNDVMKKSGFADVRMLTDDGVTFNGVTLKRTYAKHGTKEPCGPASGIFFTAPGEKKTLWILGDTIWCDEVAKTMAELKPDVVVLNAAPRSSRHTGASSWTMRMSKASAAPRQTPRSSRATWTRSPTPRSRARRFVPRLNGAALPGAS